MSTLTSQQLSVTNTSYTPDESMDDATLHSPLFQAADPPTRCSIVPTERGELFIAGIVLEYKHKNTADDPPDDLTLVMFCPKEEMGKRLPLEKTSATSWLVDGFVQTPGFGEELIMIGFWMSESEGRKVIYHLITGEDTGSSREFVADIDSPTFAVRFNVGAIVGEGLDNRGQNAEETVDEEAAQLPSPANNFMGVLTDVGRLFFRRFKKTGDISDISKAISVEEQLVARTLGGDPKLLGRLTNLGILFSTRFKCTGDVLDISASISARERAVDLIPDCEDILSLLTTLGASYMCRFSFTQDLLDISKEILVLEKVVQRLSEDDKDLPSRLNVLGESLRRRFEHEGNLFDISEAILAQERAVQLTPDGDRNLAGRLNNLCNSYRCRFEHSGVISDISEAISILQKAVSLSSDSYEHMPLLLSNLGGSLMLRFKCTGNHLDIEGATALLKKAVRLAPEGHELAPTVLNNYGMALWDLFKLTGDATDISDAISAHQKALALISASDRATCLNNLGISFSYRFEECGDLLDICEAISAHQESVSLTKEHHPKMPIRLNNLAIAFIRRYKQRGDPADSSSAISTQQRAMHLVSEDHASMPTMLNTLGSSLSARFEKTKDLKDISEAISIQERAVQSTPKDHTGLPMFLNNLGSSFRFRFEQTGDLGDITKAISAHKQAIYLIPEPHPYLPTLLKNLGKSLMASFKATKNKNTISEAISALNTAIQHSPEGHPLVPSLFSCLADLFLSRFEQEKDHSDLEKARSNYRQSANEISGPPSIRLGAAKQWATLALKVNASESEVMAAFSTAVRLTSQVAGLEQTIQMRHSHIIANISDLSTTAAAAALSFGRHGTAVEWLEQGRCLVWSQINNLRTPLDDLHEHDPALANHFSAVSRALERSGSRAESLVPDINDNIRNNISIQDEVQKHVKLARRWEELLHEIRGIDGFHDFLQPPSISSFFSRLPKAGPIVIINAHLTRCDAIALLPGAENSIHIPLDNFSYAEANGLKDLLHRTCLGRGQEDAGVELRMGGPVHPKHELETPSLRKILLELWLHVVKPILNKLVISFPTAHPPRVWWCATGPLAFLPLHAAGSFGRDKQHSECLSDFAISSYTPTVTALIERVTKKTTATSPTVNNVLLVSQLNAPAPLRPIPGTAVEIEAVWKELTAHEVRAIRVEGDAATVGRVRDDMGIHDSIHLACHAIQDTRHPMRSGFVMRDGRLELSDIIRIQNPQADLAFLSACQTSTGDEQLSEEAVHLAGGMLAAGYRGVVATMWTINDKHAVEIAKDFYNNLLSYTPDSGQWEEPMSGRAAYALRHASERVRERLGDSEDALYVWVPYVHFGI